MVNFETAMTGLLTAVALEELARRIKGYEDGTLDFNKEDALRDLKAATNAGNILNQELLKSQGL